MWAARETFEQRNHLLGQDIIDAFERDGFVMVHGLLTEDEIERYSEAVTRVVRRSADNDTPHEQKSPYQQSYIQCINLWEESEEVRSLTFHPRLGQAAAELMGVGAVRLWHDAAVYKQPNGRRTDAHQDHSAWPISETNSCTAWIPFEGSTIASGALGYLPGSHKIGLRKFKNIYFGEPEDMLAEPELRAIEPVWLEVPRGSVAFHHGLTVHFAKANKTDSERGVHTIIYFPDGSTRGSSRSHFAVDRPGIEVGRPIDGDTTPIVWPRPDGDLPNPPGAPLSWSSVRRDMLKWVIADKDAITADNDDD
jgi:ectoine hydroxylase-related dioxygenase (phytanoyl-CoA dioxygenase family)